jgi:hypothetical protein
MWIYIIILIVTLIILHLLKNKNFETMNDNNILIIICSKSPNPNVYDCVKNLYDIQIKNDITNNYKIVIVDSDSDDFTNYEKIKKDYEVEILDIKNKNYEYGAYKYAYEKYPNYNVYVCLQDTLILKNNFDINLINDFQSFVFVENSGYFHLPEYKNIGIEKLKNASLDYDKYIDINDSFMLAQHNSFIISKKVMNDIFNTFKDDLPLNKKDSEIYERNFGVYFIVNEHKIINIADYFEKIHGNRN